MSIEQGVQAHKVAYPHIVALWSRLAYNPLEAIRELHAILRAIFKAGKLPRVGDIPKHLRKYITQAISFKTLRSVYGDDFISKVEAGAVTLPEDFLLPDAVIVGRIRHPGLCADEITDALLSGDQGQAPTLIRRPTEWVEGASEAEAEQAFLKAALSLKAEFTRISDARVAASQLPGVSLITYVYTPIIASPVLGDKQGFDVMMEFRQVTRLSLVSAKDLNDFEVVSEMGDYPVKPPSKPELMTLTRPAEDIVIHNPFRNPDGSHKLRPKPPEVK